ncbi:hypothetical protein MTR67_038912 [Solanum verrucosum]|uniref:Uncharacterized protein n=1 Tax=Solanum verrucosum TaxID=315347 RepID=A0AAF0ZN61_SOLVR|nr:hypothetical protein MTR67_038912 [Solanum verrucosum]
MEQVPRENFITTSNKFETLEEAEGSRPIQMQKAIPLISKRSVIDGSPVMGRGGDIPFLMDSIGFWNTRGLNRAEKQKEMNLFLHNSKTALFGLLETKVKRAKAQGVAFNLVMHCEAKHKGTGKQLIVTMVYGFNDQAQRWELSKDLISVQATIHGAWAVMGDFNSVANWNERIGRTISYS